MRVSSGCQRQTICLGLYKIQNEDNPCSGVLKSNKQNEDVMDWGTREKERAVMCMCFI